MNDTVILKTFIEENSAIARNILQQTALLKNDKTDKSLSAILTDLKIIKCNARIMEFNLLEKLCNGYEEIILAVLTKKLLFTELVNDFITKVSSIMINYIENLHDENSSCDLQKWIVDCDRIAAGMILETNLNDATEEKKENFSEEKNIIISSARLNELITSFNDVSIHSSRLHQQINSLNNINSYSENDFLRLKKNIYSTFNDLESLLKELQEKLHESAMIRLSRAFSEFQLKNYTDTCKIEIEETDLMVDKEIIPHLSKILNLFFQNSKEYGLKNIKNPKVTVSAKINDPLIELVFADNGNGFDYNELRNNIIATFPHRKTEIEEMDEDSLGMFLFAAGMTSTETGLNEAWKEIDKIKGKLKIRTEIGKGTSFILIFPKSLSSESGFTIRYGNKKYFIPSNYVVESVSKTNGELITDTSKPYFIHRNQKIRIYRMSSIMPSEPDDSLQSKNSSCQILIIENLELKIGIIVDEVISFSSKIIKKVPAQLSSIKEVKGMVIDENYDIIPVLNIPALIKRFTWLREYELKKTEVAARKIVKNILIVDSSDFARHIIHSIYETQGFFIIEARDGIEALEILKTKEVCLIISAVEMPRMNGLTLLDNIKRNQKSNNIPVILFPFEADLETEKSYLASGAGFVIRKNNFDRNTLLNESLKLMF